MPTHPQTIQIFLPSGDPQGLRAANITTRTVLVVDVPRSLLADFFEMPEAEQVGIYFLIGENDESGESKLYVGQSGALTDRLTDHNKKKEFWQRALIAVSVTQSLTVTHAAFLEWLSIQKAGEAGRYELDNGNAGTRPHTPAPLEAECNELHETIRVLLATLGHPVFESLARRVNDGAEKELFFCTSAGIRAQGLYTEEGFVVLKDSVGRLENVPSLVGTSDEKFRQKLIDNGVMAANGKTVVFLKDHLFNSPSMAAIAVLGRTANGWMEWKTKDGQTLDAIKRQACCRSPKIDQPCAFKIDQGLKPGIFVPGAV